MKKPMLVLVAVAAAVAMLAAPALAVAAKKKFKANLDGFQETPLTISTTASGELRLKVNEGETEIAMN